MGRTKTTTSAGAVYWFNGPNEFEQRLSLIESALDHKAKDAVEEVTEKAANMMRDILDAGGVNTTQKGGGRRLSGDMRASIDWDVFTNPRKRAQGTFGFTDDAPFYTKFQERGTVSNGPKRAHEGPRQKNVGSGIPAMLAYASALEFAITEFQNKIDDVAWFSTSNTNMTR